MSTPPLSSDDWADFLRRVTAAPDRLVAIREHQVTRWSASDPVRAEEYLARFPDLSNEDALVLILAEVQLRRERGEVVQLGEYQSRFPQHASDLAFLFELSTHDYRSGTPASAVNTQPPVVPGFDVREVVGEGSFGRVYAARDLTLDRDVAIKILLNSRPTAAATARFTREAKIAAALLHPGIPPVHAMGTLANGAPFLAMKLIRGKTLAALLRERASPADQLPHFVHIFEQVAQTVASAHNQGVIHRDLKTANVMVGAFGEVQVVDWGLAKEPRAATGDASAPVSGAPEEGTASFVGAIQGSPAYMAPEQARGEAAAAPADVFALGGILCEILTGLPTFHAKSVKEALRASAAGDVSDAQARLATCGADPELVSIATQCLRSRVEDRPSEAGKLAALVAAYRMGVEERLRRAEREKAATEARKIELRKKRRVQFALGLAVLVLVASGAAAGWWRDRQRLTDEQRMAKNEAALASWVEKCETALRNNDANGAQNAMVEIDRRSEDGGGNLADRIARCRADLKLLLDLDAVDRVRWTWVAKRSTARPADNDPDAVERFQRTIRGGMPTGREMLSHWRSAFRAAGFDPTAVPPDELAQQLGASLLRERLLATLDTWLVFGREKDVREVLRRADPHPYRDEVRDAIFGAETNRLVKLIDRADALQQTAGLTAAIGQHLGVQAQRRREILRHALRAHQNDLTLLMVLGVSYGDNGSEESINERVRWFQAAVAAHPRSAAAHYNLGISLTHRHDIEGYVAEFETASQLDPQLAPAFNNLAHGLCLQGKLDQALAAVEKALVIDSSLYIFWGTKAMILRDQGDKTGALIAFAQFARLMPPGHAAARPWDFAQPTKPVAWAATHEAVFVGQSRPALPIRP